MTWELVGHRARPRTSPSPTAGSSPTCVRGAAAHGDLEPGPASATYLVSLIVAPLARIHDTWHGIPVDYYVYHDDSAPAWRAVPRDARHDRTLLAPHGHPLPVGQVRPDHGGRLLRRHGERERHHAGRLAARRARLPGPAVVPVAPDPARARAPVVRRLRDDRELGEHVAQRGLRRVHAGPVLGRRSSARTRSRTTTSTSTGSSCRSSARRSMPLASLGSNNIYPKGALVLEMLEHYLGPRAFLGRRSTAT